MCIGGDIIEAAGYGAISIHMSCVPAKISINEKSWQEKGTWSYKRFVVSVLQNRT